MSNKGKISYIMYAIAIWGSFEHRNCVKMSHITYIYLGGFSILKRENIAKACVQKMSHV